MSAPARGSLVQRRVRAAGIEGTVKQLTRHGERLLLIIERDNGKQIGVGVWQREVEILDQ